MIISVLRCFRMANHHFWALVFATLITVCAFSQPTISSFSPVTGPIGSSVTITGTNFSPTASNNTVFFGPVRASVTAASATSLTVTVPAGATYQSITVTVNGLTAYSLRQFDVTYTGGGLINGSTFQGRIDSTTDLYPNAVVVADLDGDGKPDIATPNNYSSSGQPASISILRNTSAAGNISYAPVININNGVLTYAMTAADIDGDGKTDLLASSIMDQTVSVFRNTSTPGNISFATKVDLATEMGVYSITVGDFDKDGKPDVALVIPLLGRISMFRNTGSSGVISFAPKVDISISSSERITSTDLDGDGKTDLVFTNQTLGILSILRNTSTTGNFSFATRIDIPCQSSSQPYNVTAGDLDGDGKNDLAVTITNFSSSGVQLYRNSSTPGNIVLGYVLTLPGANGSTGYDAALGDINGDGKPDLTMSYASGAGKAKSFQNNSTLGTISFGTGNTYTAFYAPYGVAICDMDADGKPELALSEFTSDKVSVFRNKCGSPEITSFTPVAASSGGTITITGTNFINVTSVSFGTIPAASYTVVNATTITAVLGTGATGDVKVTNNAGSGSMAGFQYQSIPVITSFTPTSGYAGMTIRITGYNFTNYTAVSFGGTPAQGYYSVDPFNIYATLGNGSSGDVSVTTPFGTGSLSGFTYAPTPVINSFSPASAGTGITVTISGLNFTGTSQVSFGGVNATAFNVVNDNTVTAVVGNGASGNVVVTNAFGTDTKPGFNFIQSPVIQSFSPVSAASGSNVTITGTNFTNASSVKFGGVGALSFTVVNPTTINATPSLLGASGAVSVTTPGGSATLSGFTFIPPPVITSFSPRTTGTGAVVTITGTDFLNVTSVKFGGVPAASFNVVNSNTMTAVVGAGATGVLSVTAAGGVGSVNGFTFVTTPIINSFSPVAAPAGTVVTLTGANFNPVAANNTVYFGAAKANIITANANTITVTVPAGTTFQNISLAAYGLMAYSSGPFRLTYSGGGAFNANSFAGRADFSTASQPGNIAAGDLDGDGYDDIVVTNIYSASISVFRNTSSQSSLSFAPRMDIDNGPYPHALKIEDINADGKPDVICLNYNTAITGGSDNYISIFRNISTPGNIQFAPRLLIQTGTSGAYIDPLSFVITDLNADGLPDFAVAHTHVFMPNGNPFISTYVNNSTPAGISFMNAQISEVIIYPNHIFSSSISVADFNLDAKPDILLTTAMGSSFNNLVVMLNQTGLGSTFVQLSTALNLNCGTDYNIAYATDFDYDGKPDILTDNCFFRNTTTSAANPDFSSQSMMGIGGTLGIDMLSGSGYPDLVRVNPYTSTVSAVRNMSSPGTVTFDPDVNYPVGTTPVGVVIADLNGDGKQDIATANRNLNTFSVLLNRAGYSGLTISSFTPSGGPTGTLVTITGTNFTGVTGVSFGGVPASSFTVVNPTTITATVGNGNSGNVSVTNGTGTVSLGWFYFAPTITSATPLFAAAGSQVTINGSGFTGTSAVSFGGTASTSFVILSPNVVLATVANGASGNISLTTPGGTATLAGFNFCPVPTITSFSPTTGTQGTVVTIKGTGFIGVTSLTFGLVPAASFTMVNDTTLTAVLGSGGSGNVTVTTPGGIANAGVFIFNYTTGIGGPGSVNSPDLTVSPNPGSQIVVIRHPVTTTGKGILRFTDVYGRAVITIQPARNDAQSSADVGKLSAGVYLIRWSDGKKELIRLFMKD